VQVWVCDEMAALHERAERARAILADLGAELARRWPDGTPDAEQWRAGAGPRIAEAARAASERSETFAAWVQKHGAWGAWDRCFGRGRRDELAICMSAPHLRGSITLSHREVFGDPTARSERGRDASYLAARDRALRDLVANLRRWVDRWGPKRGLTPVPLDASERGGVLAALSLLGEPSREMSGGSCWGDALGAPDFGCGAEADVDELERLLVGADLGAMRERDRHPLAIEAECGWPVAMASRLLGGALTPRAIKEVCATKK
jgi:hypothetical protein